MSYKDPDKQREYQRKWMADRRAVFFDGKSCVKCGSKDRMELDHVDPTKKVSHRIWSWSETRRNSEIAKCQVLCYKCHKNRTRLQSLATEHGTYAMRNHHGCKCDECMEYGRRRMSEWRARTGRSNN